jgi:hypothetical protein
VVGALVTSGPSSAKSSKTPVKFWQVDCLVDPGIDWVSDEGILHGRGRVVQFFFYAYDPPAEIIGVGVSVSNANIDLATGDGQFSGTVSVLYLPVSATEAFYGTYHGSLTGWGVSISGQGISHGTGDARGVKIKLHFDNPPPPQWLEELPTACPPDLPKVGISHNVGYVHEPHGG